MAKNKRIRRMYNTLVLAKDQRRKQNIFDALRNASHTKFLGRLGQMEIEFKADLESKILVQYQNKVDSLLLYAAELEDKIKLEQDAREKMTILYD